jgi:hypothetical protein
MEDISQEEHNPLFEKLRKVITLVVNKNIIIGSTERRRSTTIHQSPQNRSLR